MRFAEVQFEVIEIILLVAGLLLVIILISGLILNAESIGAYLEDLLGGIF